MRRWLLSPAVLAAVLSFAQTPAEVEITQEPHHHFLFENEYVRVFRVEVAPQESTLMHRHRHDYIFVTLGATDVSNEVAGKPPVELKLQDGETRFLPGGFAHAARDLASTPFRNITVELLQDDQVRQHPPAPWDEERGLKVFNGGTQEILFVKDGVRASEIEMQPDATIPSHHHAGPHLLVAITDLDVRSDVKGNASTSSHLKSGDAKWVSGGYTHTLTNTSKSPAKFITLEFP